MAQRRCKRTRYPGIYAVEGGKSPRYMVSFRIRGLGQRTRTFPSLREAREFQGSARDPARNREMRQRERGRISLAEYFPKWLERRRNLSESTRLRYEGLSSTERGQRAAQRHSSGGHGLTKRRRREAPVLVAFALLGLMLVPAPATAVPSGFVVRDGTQLLLDGNPYRFTGLNIYNANSDGWCGAQMDQGTALDDALTAIGPGKQAIRSWFFQPLAINKDTDQRDWSAFDHTLQVADAHGMKVIATLTDQWGECGTDVSGNGYKTAEWYVDGYQQVQPGMLVSYRDWVAEVVARYKDDPRVAFWQLINEAEVTPCPSGDLQPYQTLHDWAADVSGLVKSIDPNHLVSLGTIGSGQCGADGPRYEQLHQIPTIDLCEFHDYGSPTVGVPGDEFNGLQVRIDQCTALNKPIFVGEAGIKPNDVGGTLQARADAFEAKMAAQFGAGVQGFLAWAWSPQTTPVSTLDNYDIGPGDPALAALVQPATLPGDLDLTFGGDGKVTTDFVVGRNDQAWAVVLLGGSKIVAAGSSEDGYHFALAGYNADGTLDTSFGTGGQVTTDFAGGFAEEAARAAAVDTDGRIVVAGYAASDFALARYNADGTLDTSFGTGGRVTTDFAGDSDGGLAVVLQGDGKIVVAGNASSDFALARYNADGTLDTSFGTGGKVTTDLGYDYETAAAVALQGDGKIVTAGWTLLPAANGPDFALARYNPDGTLDSTFGAGGTLTTDFEGRSDSANAVAVQGDGKIVVAGSADLPPGFSGQADFALARYNPDGTLDSTFGAGGKATTDFGGNNDQAEAIALQGGGKILAAGSAYVYPNPNDFALARYNPDGTLDPTFGAAGKVTTDFSYQLIDPDDGPYTVDTTDGASAMAIQGDGRIVAAGSSRDSDNAFALARYLGGATTTDTTDPTIALTTPPEGASYALDEQVNADYSCSDEQGGSGLATCSGDVSSGAAIDTSTLGNHSFTVTAEDNANNTASVTHTYAVVAPPDQVMGLAPTYGDGTVTLTWQKPADNGSAIDHYVVTGTSPGLPDATPSRVDGGDTLTITYSALTHCVPYSFTVAAHNAAGLGAGSQASSVTVSGVTAVQVGESATQYLYTPKNVTVASDQCVRLNWTFNATNTRAHTVTEASASNTGLGAASAPLFNSGPINAGGSFSSPLLSGATFYQYRSVASGESTSPSLYGSVTMPVVVSPASGAIGSAFTVQWAPTPMPGYSFTIQYQFRRAGTTKWPTTWTPWLADQTGNKATFTPIAKNGAGMYRFQARIKNTSTKKQGGWSWVASSGLVCPCQITVT